MKRSSIWTIVVLVAGYIMFQLVADVTAVKQVQIGQWALPGGSLVFAATFTWRDMLHKRLGKEWARAAIVTAAVCNVFMALYFLLVLEMPAAVWWGGQDAMEATLGVVWRIALASIVAELVSELVDTEIYGALMKRFTGPHQWVRVAVSNAISLPLDSFIFATLAFAGVLPTHAIIDIVIGQIVFKAAITVISLPLIYTVKERPVAMSFSAVGAD